MINSFEIKNFRNLNGLSIKNFERVNLISGKNNTGKTNLLQAIELFVSDFNFDILKKQLESKRELSNMNFRNINEENYLFKNIQILNNLFSNNISEQFEKKFILKSDQNEINISFLVVQNNSLFQDEISINSLSIKSFNKQNLNKQNIIRLEENIFRTIFNISLENNIQFIETNSIEKKQNSNLWDNINLTDNEKFVVEALNIIVKTIIGISFKSYKNSSERFPVVKLSNNPNIVPLKSMGDGINRILTIILALVNVKDGYLFIDEFENGLHYSVQKDLWKIIFYLADKLNIQVFATTHSSDCINAFQEVINDNEINTKGQFIRLENKNGEIREVSYTNEVLKYASENDIEVR
jgi:AAA15 family ATPase/GTPase